MKKLILVDLGTMSDGTAFEFEQFPATRKELIAELIDRGQSKATFEGKSLTLMERLLTLELDDAQIPQDLVNMTISINPVKKMKAGADVNYAEVLAMIPSADDGYHKIIKALRQIRNWAEDKEQEDCQNLFIDLLPTTTKDDLMIILGNTRKFVEGKLATPEVRGVATPNGEVIEALTKANEELDNAVVELTTRVTALELRAGIITNISDYLATLKDKFAAVKKFYSK